MNIENIILELKKIYERDYGKWMDNKDWIGGYNQAIKDLRTVGKPFPVIVHAEPDKCPACNLPLSIRNKKQGGGIKPCGVEPFCNNKKCKGRISDPIKL